MFNTLSERLQASLRRLRSKGRLSEADVDQALREVRLALLEADVNFKVVKEFVARVREKAVGEEVLGSFTPAQQVVKIVHQELVRLLGSERAGLRLSGHPAVILLVGLQGSGKTTTAGKLGGLLRREGHRPLLVACDIYRPAAREQLKIVGQKLGLTVFTLEGAAPADIAGAGVEEARRRGFDVVIIDTAGRLHVDEEMMEEARTIRQRVSPDEVLLVVDAMTGQDAVNVAQEFHRSLQLTGVVLTKLDGDARGGAALSVREVTGVPIKFVGVGEKLDDLEPFFPERMASRILGMGDVLTLIEKAQRQIDQDEARRLTEKMLRREFTLDDFLEQIQQVRKLGPLDQLLGMLPGFNRLTLPQTAAAESEKQLKRVEAMIRSMTPQERRHPEIIDASRRRRIAQGSGTTVQDVNRLLKEFEQVRQLMKGLSGPGKAGKGRSGGRLRLPFPR
ncbi:MAG: signal recognition particle protein [Limnochordales bacterium]|nr:signal recognition particle protein [Limnochordales bacterium]